MIEALSAVRDVRRFSSYPKYAECASEWLDAIPEGWELRRLKTIIAAPVTDGPHETPEFLLDGIPFLSVDGIQEGELVFEGCRFISKAASDAYRRKCAPRPNDILLGKAASTGKIARVKVDLEFSVWSPLALIRPAVDQIDPRYLEFALKSPETQAEIDFFCTSNTQKNIAMADIPRLTVALPPLDEQRAIADFLDRETSKIDGLVAKKERLIELLQEKRTALITHAVTKGLDPNAPMKPSGSPFLPEVPAHWTVTRVRYLCRDVADGPHFSPTYVDDGVLFISARNVKVDGWSFDDAKYVSELDYREFSKRIVPERGDVLYTKGGTTGIARAVDFDTRFQVWVHIAVLKLLANRVDPFFLAYALNGKACYEQSQLYTRGATNKDLGLTRLINISIVVPPLEEQRYLVQQLDRRTQKLDQLIMTVRDGLVRLREYRTALISAAVTGKIDVREEVE